MQRIFKILLKMAALGGSAAAGLAGLEGGHSDSDHQVRELQHWCFVLISRMYVHAFHGLLIRMWPRGARATAPLCAMAQHSCIALGPQLNPPLPLSITPVTS
jgi:hypothetical protein